MPTYASSSGLYKFKTAGRSSGGSSGTTAAGSYPVFEFIPGSSATPSNWDSWIKSQPAPKANPNTRLPLLGRYGWQLHPQIRIDLGDRWGYGYELSNGTGDARVVNILAEWNSPTPTLGDTIVLKHVAQSLSTRKVAVGLAQVTPNIESGYMHDANGNRLDWSPIASVAAMDEYVRMRVAPFVQLKNALNIDIAVIQDGGEVGINVVGDDPATRFGQDAAVVADRGSTPWPSYISTRKAFQQKQVYDAVDTAFPNRQIQIYYPCSASIYDYIPNWQNWGYYYDDIKVVSDLPSSSSYYKEFNNSLGDPAVLTGDGRKDLLTHCSYGVTRQIIDHNQPLSYNYVCGGWYLGVGINSPPSAKDETRIVARDLYQGFLKSYFALGNIGAIAGYFSPDLEYWSIHPYDPNTPPTWLWQLMDLGEIRARFSYLDNFILDGDLLSGDRPHSINSNYPSREYSPKAAQGDLYLSDSARVFARKLKTEDKYLIVAWSPVGADRLVYVNSIPALGNLQLNARRKGSIYVAEVSNGVVRLLHLDP